MRKRVFFPFSVQLLPVKKNKENIDNVRGHGMKRGGMQERENIQE